MKRVSVHTLAVPCPRTDCGAHIGQCCCYIYGKYAPHPERITAAQKRAKEIIKQRIEQEQRQ